MKILHFASGDLWAGAESQLFTLAKAQAEQADVHVILLNHGELAARLKQASIPTQILDETQLSSASIFRALSKSLISLRPDVLHTHRCKENILGALAAWRTGIPSLRSVHGALEYPPSPLKNPKGYCIDLLDRISGRWLQKKIVAVSQPLGEYLTHHYPPDKVGVIENGIDINTVTAAAALPIQDLPENNDFNIIFAGRLVPVKRLDLLLEAVKIAAKQSSRPLKLYILGDGPLKPRLQAQAADLKLEDQVIFMGHKNNIYPYLKRMHCFLLTSDHEGLPMAALEAMALKIPVIAHNVGGLQQLLQGGKTGYPVTDHKPAGYAACIEDCMTARAKAHAKAESAHAYITNFHSDRSNAEQYLSLYKSIAHV